MPKEILVQVRIPPSLHDKLQSKAKEHDRSLTSEVKNILATYEETRSSVKSILSDMHLIMCQHINGNIVTGLLENVEKNIEDL